MKSGRGTASARFSCCDKASDILVIHFSSLTGLEMQPMPSISTSTTSPSCKHGKHQCRRTSDIKPQDQQESCTLSQRGGLRKHPTPGGVPVKIKSPGCRVIIALHHSTILFTLNTSWLVLESWTVSPFNRHRMPLLWMSPISSVVTMAGPMGAKVSKVCANTCV